MSLPAPCPGCLMGQHEKHDEAWNITPGLIGGNSCDCPGDCAEVSAAQVDVWAATFRDALPLAHPTTDPDG